MAWATADGELRTSRTSPVRFEVAAPVHDAAIRRVLRESVMDGEIVLARKREPAYFAGVGIAGAEDETVLAMEDGDVAGIASCSIRLRYVNGIARRVGYLNELRLARSHQGRYDILRRGYQFYAARHRDDPADIYFTSIAADNDRSMRFLERNLPGMPRYEFLSDYYTLLISSRMMREASLQTERLLDASTIAACLNEGATQYQFAAHWTEGQIDSLRQWDLPRGDFLGVREGGQLAGCAALWDQRGYRQTVIRKYSRRLRTARPLINLFARIFGHARLPSVDSVLSNAFLSPLGGQALEHSSLLALIKLGLHAARQRGIEMVTLGFSADDPRLPIVKRRFRCRSYRTRLYRVHWPHMETKIGELDGRPIGPDIALL